MGYRPGELIQNTTNYLLRLLEEHGSFDYSAFYDGTAETNDRLCAELGIEEEDGEWFSAPHLVDTTVSQLEALGLVTVAYLDTDLADGEPNYLVTLTPKGRTLLRRRPPQGVA